MDCRRVGDPQPRPVGHKWKGQSSNLWDMLIGATGHRDLNPQEIPALRAAVRRFLTHWANQSTEPPLMVASSLWEGADLLVTEEALSLGVDCCAVLPLPAELYRTDFGGAHALRRFEQALARCKQTILCSDDASADSDRTARYAAAGERIARQASILLALWDGRPEGQAGGTAQTVGYRLSLEQNLVFHIVASRQGRSLAAGLAPLQEGYRRTIDGPLEGEFPR
jgi:hypothetical protein